MSLLQLPLSKFKSLNLSTPFLHGSSSSSPLLLKKPSSTTNPLRLTTSPMPPIRAVKYMTGKVICDRSDKTVNVQVVRLAAHPKYKRLVRKLKKYQAHDPDNRFKVGDIVQLQKIRPISKMKTFLAIASPSRNTNKRDATAAANAEAEAAEEEASATAAATQELELPLESEQA